jgi:hypothetical protein
MLKQLSLALLAVAAVVPSLGAQMRGGFARPLAPRPAAGRGVTFTARDHSPAGRGFFLGDTPYFYADYPFQSFAAEPAPLQASPPRPVIDWSPEAKSEPLLIELQGDRYVRFGGAPGSGQRQENAAADYAGPTTRKLSVSRKSAPPVHADAALKAPELPPAVLIYRDGRHEEVSDYAIIGAVMYARGDCWHDGYCRKNIQLSDLNISATLQANQDNGVKFALPSSPNEVVTRP